MRNKEILLIAGIIATLGVMATGFLYSQVQAVPKICAGNPHDRDSGIMEIRMIRERQEILMMLVVTMISMSSMHALVPNRTISSLL